MKNLVNKFYNITSCRMQFLFGLGLGYIFLSSIYHLFFAIKKASFEDVLNNTILYFSLPNFIETHQAIFVGILALVGALATIHKMQDQIDKADSANVATLEKMQDQIDKADSANVATLEKMQAQIDKTEELAEIVRKRKLKAARAVAPLTFSALYDYALEVGNALSLLYVLMEKGEKQEEAFFEAAEASLQIDFPHEAFSNIKEITEQETHEHIQLFAYICALSQLINARTESVKNLRKSGTIISPTNIIKYTLDCVDLMARIGAMFEYVRNLENNNIRDHSIYYENSMNLIISATVSENDFVLIHKNNVEADYYNKRFLQN